MTPQNLLTLFRSNVQDTVEPYSWTDDDAYSYMSDAESMFCRLTDGIADATTASVVEVPVAEDDEWVDISPLILKIRAASRDSDGAPIDIVNYEDLPSRGIRLDGRTGPLQTVIAGMEENKLRLQYKASTADTIRLLVFRKPLVPLTAASTEFEIKEEHHFHLLQWMERCAYLKHGTETLDTKRSMNAELRFQDYCALVMDEQRRLRHKPRTVAYGGIPMSGSSRNSKW